MGLQAAPPCTCSDDSPAAWHVVETANFRLLSYGAQRVDRNTAEACETLRATLVKQWLGLAGLEIRWAPKCDIVLHSTEEAYLREVGNAGRNTVASSLINRKQENILARRIDINATQSDWLSTALGHELTHVVLADRFSKKTLPRWIDEGMAILADPPPKQSLHRQDLQRAIATRMEFRLSELLAMADYPAARRWGAFYGQSASLVKFLVDRAGTDRFMEFIDVTLERGYEQGLRQVYQLGIADLERHWHAQLRAPAPVVAQSASPPILPVGTTSTNLATGPMRNVSLQQPPRVGAFSGR